MKIVLAFKHLCPTDADSTLFLAEADAVLELHWLVGVVKPLTAAKDPRARMCCLSRTGRARRIL
jgi:hypothetical protein